MKRKQAIKELLEKRSPKALRKSLNSVFFTYCSLNQNTLPLDFDIITLDCHALVLFLENLEGGAEDNE
jgi:hypothetical protein